MDSSGSETCKRNLTEPAAAHRGGHSTKTKAGKRLHTVTKWDIMSWYKARSNEQACVILLWQAGAALQFTRLGRVAAFPCGRRRRLSSLFPHSLAFLKPQFSDCSVLSPIQPCVFIFTSVFSEKFAAHSSSVSDWWPCGPQGGSLTWGWGFRDRLLELKILDNLNESEHGCCTMQRPRSMHDWNRHGNMKVR